MYSGLIYDVGANNGDDSAHYLAEGFRVVAIEANPTLAAHVANRFVHEIEDGQLSVLNVGIWNTPGSLDFDVNETNDEHSSFVREVAGRDGAPFRVEQVPTRTFASIVEEHRVGHYVKVDIERADVFCLEDLTEDTAPTYLSIEAHRLDYLTLMHRLGYRRFKVVDQTAHNRPVARTNWTATGRVRQLVQRKARNLQLRRGVDPHAGSFLPGSSGPFGEATPGEWQTMERVAFDWLAHELGHWDVGTIKRFGWFDFHAAR